MDNGDVFITYVNKRDRPPGSDGTCCDFKEEYGALAFFSVQKNSMSERDLNAFAQDNRSRRIDFGRHDKLTFSDGSTVERAGETHPRCYVSFPYHIIKKSENRRTVARKSLLYLRAEPRRQSVNPYCEGARGLDHVSKRVDSVVFNFVGLEDDTFVVYEYRGNLLIRFDKNLDTKFKNDRVFLIDTEIIEEKARELQQQGQYDHQTIDDVLAEHLEGLSRRNQR